LSPARTRTLYAAAALLFLVALDPAARALPRAGAYPSRVAALERPSAVEEEALRRINEERRANGLRPLAWDPILSAVAREHSRDMAEHDYLDYVSPRLGTLDYRRHRAGSPAGNLRLAIARAASVEGLLRQLREGAEPFHLSDGTHLGIGVAKKGLLAGMYVTLIAAETHSTLQPFPTMPLYGRKYRLAGRIEEGYAEPRLIITTPRGDTIEEALRLSAAREFETTVAFDRGKGEYILEIVATGRLGPVVLNLMRCYAGVPYPDPPPATGSEPLPQDLRRAERTMLEMINRERTRAGLEPLVFDERIAAVAREHSRDMLRNRYFAHVSPTRGDLSARIARAGLADTARSFTENIAANRSLREAHEGLMNSPGHRKNIMDPLAERVGIGIVRRGDDILVTQDFARANPKYDTAALAREFLAAVNEARRAKGAQALSEDATLSRIARENAIAMSRAGRPDYERARELLKKVRVAYAVQIGVLKSGDPPGPGHIAQCLEERYRRIGIGIVQGSRGPGHIWTTVLLAE